MTIFSPRPVMKNAVRGMAIIAATLFLHSQASALTFATTSDEPNKSGGKSGGKSGAALQKSDDIQIFDVKIAGASLNNLKQPPSYFDFSKIELMKMPAAQKCRFEFKRRQNKSGKEQVLANGIVEIHDSRLVFKDHNWRVRGMATPTFLKTEANLVVDPTGNIVGKAPFFLLFTDPGEIARPPKYVALGEMKKETGDAKSPIGVHPFPVDNWAMGLLNIHNCTDIT